MSTMRRAWGGVRRATLALLAAVAGALWLVPAASADAGSPPPEVGAVPLIVTAILFVVAVAGLSLLQFRSARRRRLPPEPKEQPMPDTRKEDKW